MHNLVDYFKVNTLKEPSLRWETSQKYLSPSLSSLRSHSLPRGLHYYDSITIMKFLLFWHFKLQINWDFEIAYCTIRFTLQFLTVIHCRNMLKAVYPLYHCLMNIGLVRFGSITNNAVDNIFECVFGTFLFSICIG